MKHLEPKETYQFLHDNPTALFIDCRSEMEFLFVGHPVGAHDDDVDAQFTVGERIGRAL